MFTTNSYITILSTNHKTPQVNKTGIHHVSVAGLAFLSFALRASEKNRVTNLSNPKILDSNNSSQYKDDENWLKLL